ncbi:CoA-binding protein [Aquibacillus halophilus]|uniref:CoA-binding protein n=1 Tax=Aquibacillus halophilus TaxID=930132 RepID=A0A6A8DA11_9BACI|nr:CoA-binding protein [Aquibacillus halophilus]MRH42595.1 CoA-binding protein [Aquibacillus halophilus]
MSYEHPPNQEIKEILENAKTIAVIGLSDRPQRTSYQIAKVMQQAGYRIIPVNPEIEETLGERAYDSILDVKEPFDIINVFRRPEYLPQIAKDAVKTDAKVFWAQQGIVNNDAYDYLTEHDFTVIMDMCIKVAHSIIIRNK